MREQREEFERRIDRAARNAEEMPRERGGILALLLGLLFGLAVAPFAYVLTLTPELFTEIWVAAQDYYGRAKENVPENILPYADWIALAVAVLIAFLLIRTIGGAILRSTALMGVIVGAFLWVPFGSHIRTLIPQVDERMPRLSAGLDNVTESNWLTARIRTFAEETLPPEQVALSRETQGNE